MDLTRLLTITLMTLIVSDEFERPTVASLPCDPSMILGMSLIRSSELSRLAVVTAAVAASTTEVIWELVRELENVLLVLRDETRACLELLVEMRRALSSPITVEARVSVLVEEALEDFFFAHDANIMGKNIRANKSNLNFATSFFWKRSERPKKALPLEAICIVAMELRRTFFIINPSRKVKITNWLK